MIGFILRLAIGAFGLWLAARVVDGVRIEEDLTLVWAALLLGIVNAVVRPVVRFFTFPLTVLTLGLFIFVVNAMMVGLVAWLLPGFELAGFVPALLTSIVAGLTGWVGSWFIDDDGKVKALARD